MFAITIREKSSPRDEFTSAPGAMIIQTFSENYMPNRNHSFRVSKKNDTARSYRKTARFVSYEVKEAK